jgi:hypothetical protein
VLAHDEERGYHRWDTLPRLGSDGSGAARPRAVRDGGEIVKRDTPPLRRQPLWRLLATAVALWCHVSGAAARAQPLLSIADAREEPLGSTVTVGGLATTRAGALASFTLDQGFAIQDGTAGIWVSLAAHRRVMEGRRVTVTGTLVDRSGLLALVPERAGDVRVLEERSRQMPTAIRTGDVGEESEGTLVTIEARVTRPISMDLPFGYGVWVDDGSGEIQVFVASSTGINPFWLRFVEPGRRIRVTGMSGHFVADTEEHYEVNPRTESDLQPVR